MINTNLPPIFHRLRDIAVDRSEIAILGYPSCLTPPAEGFTWDDLREIFSGCQRMAMVPNAVEIWPKISTAWVGRAQERYRRQTDDRRTGVTFAINMARTFVEIVIQCSLTVPKWHWRLVGFVLFSALFCAVDQVDYQPAFLAYRYSCPFCTVRRHAKQLSGIQPGLLDRTTFNRKSAKKNWKRLTSTRLITAIRFEGNPEGNKYSKARRAFLHLKAGHRTLVRYSVLWT